MFQLPAEDGVPAHDRCRHLVWIVAFRNDQSKEARHMRTLLDSDEVALPAPVRVEILAGASRADRAQLHRTLSALPVFYPSEVTWIRIESWLDAISAAGDWFGMGDLLIAAISADRGDTVWSLDTDFSCMDKLKLIKLYRST